jgi:hypothetical protein
MPRRDRYAETDISIDRYEDRRERDYVPRGGRGRGEDRYFEEEIEYRSRAQLPRERERERDIVVQEREEVRYSHTPDILREDYGRSSAGPLVVLRKRETEDFEYAPPRSRRRTPSPEPEPKVSREEIIIRRSSPSPERPPPRLEREVDRDEIIIRRDERSRDRRPPPPREVERDREEIIIRRDERERRGPRYDDFERDEVIIRREDDHHDRRPPPPRDFEREEIIIRHDEREDDRASRVSTRGRDDYALARPISHERERSRVGRASSEHDDEIIIRREDRQGRGGDREREEIIIRKHSRSPSPVSSVRAPPPVEVAPIYAPPIHREIIYHERHIDHGYETTLARIPSRAPSPPMPPPPRERSEERIEIRRTGERNGRVYDEDIIIDRNEGPRGRRAPEPELALVRGPYREREEIDIREERGPRGYRRDEIDIQEEADYYNRRAVDRSYVGEGLHGSTRDWEIVDVPPGTRRVKMDGAGGGSQEITWQRYNGVRRSKFMPDGSASDEGYGSEISRPAPAPVASTSAGAIGPRYGPRRKEGEGLWTEITKDLVVKEAITQAGYEFEETDDFYYIMSYLKYVSPACTWSCFFGEHLY